jgi:hypothetical protein
MPGFNVRALQIKFFVSNRKGRLMRMSQSVQLRKCVLFVFILFAISDFRPVVHKIYALLINYAAYSGNPFPAFRDNLSGPIFKGQESILDP